MANPHLEVCPDYLAPKFEEATAILQNVWLFSNTKAIETWDQQHKEELATQQGNSGRSKLSKKKNRNASFVRRRPNKPNWRSGKRTKISSLQFLINHCHLLLSCSPCSTPSTNCTKVTVFHSTVSPTRVYARQMKTVQKMKTYSCSPRQTKAQPSRLRWLPR